MSKQSMLKAAAGIAVAAAVSGGALVASTGTSEASTASSGRQAAAASIYCDCLITQVGPADHSQAIPIRLLDPDGKFTERWFLATSNQAFFLQTALAASTARRHVNVMLSDTVEYSTIQNLYMYNW
jgi:hypothetical protein